MPLRTPLVFICLLLAAAAARAEDTWTLTTADFRNASVTLKGIGADGLKVADVGQGAERTVPMDQFLQLERPLAATQPTAGQPANSKFILHLAGGDQLAGEPVALAGEDLVWNNAAAGEVRVPMAGVGAMTRPGQQPPDRRTTEDVVTLANGDAVRGIIAGLEGGKVSVQAPDAAEPVAVPVDSVARIQFASTGAAGAAAAGPSFRLRLSDSSSLPAKSLAFTDGKLSADLGDGKPRPVDLSRVAAIEQLNGPAAWLSRRPPAETVYVPFFGTSQDYAPRMDATVDGSRELRFGGKTFRRAIGVHAYSRLTWPLDGTYAAFRTQYAVDDRLPHADMTVRIKLDDKVIHEKHNAGAGTMSPIITADLAGAKTLTLEVDFGAGTDVQDRLVWLEPALLKSRPAAEPAPAAAAAPAPAPAAASAPASATPPPPQPQ